MRYIYLNIIHQGAITEKFIAVAAKNFLVEDLNKVYKRRTIAPSALFAYHRKGVRLRLSTFSNGGVISLLKE